MRYSIIKFGLGVDRDLNFGRDAVAKLRAAEIFGAGEEVDGGFAGIAPFQFEGRLAIGIAASGHGDDLADICGLDGRPKQVDQ